MKDFKLEDPSVEEIGGPQVSHKTLRHATLSDVERCLEMAVTLANETPLRHMSIDRAKIREQLTYFILNQGLDHLCLVSYDGDKVVGVIAAYAFEPLFSAEKMASEVLWYLEPEYRKGRRGLEMAEAYEYWSRLVGCRMVQYGWPTSSPEGMKRMYERSGAELGEHTYYKVL